MQVHIWKLIQIGFLKEDPSFSCNIIIWSLKVKYIKLHLLFLQFHYIISCKFLPDVYVLVFQTGVQYGGGYRGDFFFGNFSHH